MGGRGTTSHSVDIKPKGRRGERGETPNPPAKQLLYLNYKMFNF